MPLQLSLEHSNDLAGLLSLDLTRSFWPALQLDVIVPDPDGFLTLLRQAILTARQRYASDANRVSNVLAELGDALDQVGKASQAQQLADWSRHIYLGSHSDQPQLSAWEIVLVQCAYANAPEMDRDVTSAMARWADAYRDRLASLDLDARIKAQRELPLSAWDFGMFARHGWADEAFNHPLDRIASIARILAVFSSWHAIANDISPAQRRQVQEIGHAILERLQVWMPGPLLLPEAI